MNYKLSDLTPAGKLLALATAVVIGAAAYFGTPAVKEMFPREDFGKVMAVVMLFVGLVPGVLFFVASAFALRACGLPVVKPPAPPDSRPVWVVTGTDGGTGQEVRKFFHAGDEEEARAMAEMSGVVVREVSEM